MNTVATDQAVLLMVEDNPADVVFFKEAVEVAGIPLNIHLVEDGEAALRFLRRQEPFANAPRPDVIVLDLNLPLKTGRELLAEMAGDQALCELPVAVLTTSTSETSVVDTYTPGRCLYFVKTDQFRKLQNIVQQIVAYAKSMRVPG
jgi:two-component system response regulator